MVLNLQALHDFVHVLINVVSVLNTILLALDAALGSSQSVRRRPGETAAEPTARR